MSEKQVSTTSAGEASADPTPQLMQLLELSTKYPELGPPVAELAYKLGKADIGDRLVNMGLEGEHRRVEYYFVIAHAARRERRYADVLAAVADALRGFIATDSPPAEDGARLLHLVRFGFATLMFDIKDVRSDNGFVAELARTLPELQRQLGGDPFYRSLLAQTYWFSDPARSEEEWDMAVELDETEMTWNARGTWYKDASKDLVKAEDAYRRGLKVVPQSALLLHNLAQVLVDRAEALVEPNPNEARRLLSQADDHLRDALREDVPRVRRHIHATRDRLHALRRQLPKPPRRDKDRPANQGRGEQNRGDQRRHQSRGGGGGEPRGDRKGPRKGKPRDNGPGEFKRDGKFRLGDVLLAKLAKDESSSN